MKSVRSVLTQSAFPRPALLQGQHWLLYDQRVIQIGHIGRLLAHHRIIVPWLKQGAPRRQYLTTLTDLKAFLHANEAVLIQNAS